MGLFEILFGKKKFRRTTISSRTSEVIKREWQNIQIQLEGKQPSQLRQALISADKSLDKALRDILPGENMGERLKNAREKFDPKTYDKIWKAHRARNALVHEAGYEPPHYVLTEAIGDLRKGLEELGIKV